MQPELISPLNDLNLSDLQSLLQGNDYTQETIQEITAAIESYQSSLTAKRIALESLTDKIADVGSQTKYQIIYADPAWDFGNRMYSSNKNDHHREIERAYSVMKTKDICELPIKNITADDCVCFMWTTDAHIPDAIEVMKAWGFKYKTVAFIWNKKEKSGKQVCFMGQWTMKGSEIVLLGTKGKMTQHLKSRKVRQLQEAPRERTIHSRKPQIIRDRIVEMFGNELKKIELFARIKTDGWDVFGNEVEGSVNLELYANNGR